MPRVLQEGRGWRAPCGAGTRVSPLLWQEAEVVGEAQAGLEVPGGGA